MFRKEVVGGGQKVKKPEVKALSQKHLVRQADPSRNSRVHRGRTGVHRQIRTQCSKQKVGVRETVHARGSGHRLLGPHPSSGICYWGALNKALSLSFLVSKRGTQWHRLLQGCCEG